jgi:aryl sulfotransferase
MTGTVWLASYPKSGNTWFRILHANLSAAGDAPVDINDLPERGGIASARGPFDHLMLIDSGLLTHDEIDFLRPRLYEALAEGAEDDLDSPAASGLRLVKVHDAYTHLPSGEPLLGGAAAARGAIVIVRDPRDVAPSLAHHNHVSIDDAIARMNTPDARYCASRRSQPRQLRQRLLDWSGHVASWLDQRDIPVHLVRYEDLRADPARHFLAALAFAGRPATREEAERAVRLSDFDELQAQECEKGFRESSRGKPFFRKGAAGGWRDELTAEQVVRIEAAHAPMMARLGYDLAEARGGTDS